MSLRSVLNRNYSVMLLCFYLLISTCIPEIILRLLSKPRAADEEEEVGRIIYIKTEEDRCLAKEE